MVIAKKKLRRFVIDEHYATHHHFDFRLEKNGVLKSWAVPKGLPKSPGNKSLAIQTPDHDMMWLTFHGKIPKGEYGAGTVKIYDAGTYELLQWKPNKIEFILHGKKYKGLYIMVPYLQNYIIIKGDK